MCGTDAFKANVFNESSVCKDTKIISAPETKTFNSRDIGVSSRYYNEKTRINTDINSIVSLTHRGHT